MKQSEIFSFLWNIQQMSSYYKRLFVSTFDVSDLFLFFFPSFFPFFFKPIWVTCVFYHLLYKNIIHFFLKTEFILLLSDCYFTFLFRFLNVCSLTHINKLILGTWMLTNILDSHYMVFVYAILIATMSVIRLLALAFKLRETFSYIWCTSEFWLTNNMSACILITTAYNVLCGDAEINLEMCNDIH